MKAEQKKSCIKICTLIPDRFHPKTLLVPQSVQDSVSTPWPGIHDLHNVAGDLPFLLPFTFSSITPSTQWRALFLSALGCFVHSLRCDALRGLPIRISG